MLTCAIYEHATSFALIRVADTKAEFSRWSVDITSVTYTSALVDPSRDNKRGRRPKGAFQFCPIRLSCPFFCGAASFLSDSVSYSDVDLTSGAIQLLRTGSRDVLLLLLLSPDDDVTPARQSPDNVPRYKTAPPWARAIRRDLVSTFRLFASAL